MLQESNRWFVCCLMLVLAACGNEGSGAGEGGVDDTTAETQDAESDTTDSESENDTDADTDTSDAGTQTDDESTDTSDAGTQTDDESTDTSDAGTQTDDESTDTSDAGTQTDDESTDTDDNTDSSDETTPDDTDNTNTDDPEVDDEGHDLNGKWEGSYTCSQGFTRLTLQVTHDMESNTLDAVFAFYADNSNPDVPTGRYTMLGSYDSESLSVILDQGDWIEQPSGYVMVSLAGFINEEGTEITGTVDNLGCTEFTVERGN